MFTLRYFTSVHQVEELKGENWEKNKIKYNPQGGYKFSSPKATVQT